MVCTIRKIPSSKIQGRLKATWSTSLYPILDDVCKVDKKKKVINTNFLFFFKGLAFNSTKPNIFVDGEEIFKWVFYDSNNNSKTIDIPSQSYHRLKNNWFEYPIMAKRIRIFGDTNDQQICLPVEISTSNSIFDLWQGFVPALNIRINPKNEYSLIFFNFELSCLSCVMGFSRKKSVTLLLRISMEDSRGTVKVVGIPGGYKPNEKKTWISRGANTKSVFI